MGYRIVLLIKSSQLWLSSKRSTSVPLIEPFIWSILGFYFLTELCGKYQLRSKWDMHEMNFNTLITVPPVFIKSKFICISDLIISRLSAFLLVPVISSMSVPWQYLLYRDLDLLFLVFPLNIMGLFRERKWKGTLYKKRRVGLWNFYVQLEKCPAPICNIYKILSFKKMNFLQVVHANCARCMQLLPEWPSEYSKSTKQLCCCFDSIVILWIFNSLGLRLPSPHSVTLIISDKCRLRFYDHYLKPMLEWEKIYIL